MTINTNKNINIYLEIVEFIKRTKNFFEFVQENFINVNIFNFETFCEKLDKIQTKKTEHINLLKEYYGSHGINSIIKEEVITPYLYSDNKRRSYIIKIGNELYGYGFSKVFDIPKNITSISKDNPIYINCVNKTRSSLLSLYDELSIGDIIDELDFILNNTLTQIDPRSLLCYNDDQKKLFIIDHINYYLNTEFYKDNILINNPLIKFIDGQYSPGDIETQMKEISPLGVILSL